MANQWKQNLIYICGEYDTEIKSVKNLLLVVEVETELRLNYHPGDTIKLNYESYVLTERELDKKTRMITYHLQKLAQPPPLDL